jgi:DNA-binding NtrC family response regulator
MTFYASVDKAVQLLKMGAYTYLTKPIKLDELTHHIDNALEKVTLQKQIRELQENFQQKFSFKNFIFTSEQMQEILNIVRRAADSQATILISGESGTGKEVIANIIHHYSKRKDEKLVSVNLSTLPATLIEAELFGAEKGAYTGSTQTRIGKFEEADKGTIFLDEIGELAPEIQVKLLRVIQEREITRLGSNKPRKVDIRLITATNKNLLDLAKEGKFREDLYFRLNVIDIHLPTLRERKEEIPLLVDLFIEKFNKKNEKNVKAISKNALDLLVKYHYPGNIRELEHIIERTRVLSGREVLTAHDMPAFIKNPLNLDFEAIVTDHSLRLSQPLCIIEKTIIENTLKKFNLNQSKTAKELGISNSGLAYKIQQLKIEY